MFFRQRMTSLPVAFAILTLPCYVQASTEAAQNQDQITVYGSAYRSTATKTALTPQETPQGISVIDREALDERDVTHIAEALRYTSGVNTELRGGAVNRIDLFTLRGFNNYQNFYDGLQLLFNDWNLQSQIDAHGVDQVEVFKGPTSVLYGNMPPGGMVNLIAKSPQAINANQLSLQVGDHQQREMSLDSTGQLNEQMNYRLVGLWRQQDGQAETAKDERLLFAPSVDWHLSDNTLVNFNLYYQKDPSMGIYTSLPAYGMFLPNPNGRLDTNAFSGDANWNTYKREQLLVGYKINHRFNDRWTFLHNARFTKADAYHRNTYLAGANPDMRNLYRRAYLTDEKMQGFTMDNQFSAVIDGAGGIEHNLLLGVDYLYLDSDIIYRDGAIAGIDIFNPNHYQIDRTNLVLGDYNSDFKLSNRQLGFYVQDQIRMGRLILIAGGRYDRYKGTKKGLQYGVVKQSKLNQSEFTTRLGALYELDSGFSPFISYAESFEPQSGSDRSNNEFEPSHGQQWEAGIKYQGQTDDTQLTLAAFQITKDNVPTRDPNGSPYDTIQAGEIRSQGMELEASFKPTSTIDFLLAYTYTDAEITKDNNGLKGTKPVWIPEHSASAWMNVALGEHDKVGVGLRYVGEMQIDAANSGKVPSATLVDLSYRHQLGRLGAHIDEAAITLSASNVMDEPYYSCYDSSNCWFGAERKLSATLTLGF